MPIRILTSRKLHAGETLSDYGKAQRAGFELLQRISKAEPYTIQRETRVCPYFSRGQCTYGAQCRMKHQLDGDHDHPLEPQPPSLPQNETPAATVENSKAVLDDGERGLHSNEPNRSAKLPKLSAIPLPPPPGASKVIYSSQMPHISNSLK